MKQIVCNTVFKLDPFSHGGSKRSVQIRELLTKAEVIFEDDSFALPKQGPLSRSFIWALRAVLFIYRHYPKKKIKTVSNYVNLIRYYSYRIPVIYDKYKNQDVVFVWENTKDRNLLYLLKAVGRHTVAIPHNIESLVNGRCVKALEEEITILGECDVVFAISKEETWLLRLMGINAYYLPYSPPKEVESFLCKIRKKRESSTVRYRSRFALIGTVNNPPTRSGMQSLIDFFSSQSAFPFDLLVAGFGTEVLKPTSHPQISFFGALPVPQFMDLLEDIDGVILYQPPTTGALTRIPEMLIAGIPVFVNFNASRNYFNEPNLIFYDSFDDLLRKISTFKSHMVGRSEQVSGFEEFFIKTVKETVSC